MPAGQHGLPAWLGLRMPADCVTFLNRGRNDPPPYPSVGRTPAAFFFFGGAHCRPPNPPASVFHSFVALRAGRFAVVAGVLEGGRGHNPFVDKKRLNVDYSCIFVDKLVTLYHNNRGQATSITAAVDMLDLSNLTPFQRRLAKLAQDPELSQAIEGIACPVNERNSAYFVVDYFSAAHARWLSRRRFWFGLFGLDYGRVRVWLS